MHDLSTPTDISEAIKSLLDFVEAQFATDALPLKDQIDLAALLTKRAKDFEEILTTAKRAVTTGLDVGQSRAGSSFAVKVSLVPTRYLDQKALAVAYPRAVQECTRQREQRRVTFGAA